MPRSDYLRLFAREPQSMVARSLVFERRLIDVSGLYKIRDDANLLQQRFAARGWR